MENYKNIEIGYEMWKQGYALKDCSPSGEMKAYNLYIELYENGTIKNPSEFIQWMFVNEPEMLYDEVAEQQRYKEENEPKLIAYFEKHFKGKTWAEICASEELINHWDFYSDWHKDVYGYRPHGVVCGTFIISK